MTKVRELDDGHSLLIVGRRATMAAAIERVIVGANEWPVIISKSQISGHLSAAMMWMPIDTAPRDGTRILGLVRGAPPEVNILHWRDRIWWDDLDQVYFQHVTHWMPLPAPPETEK